MSRTATLTPRQAAFIPAFLATGNATASAINAGFSVKGASVAGTRMLRNACVRQALQARRSADATRLGLQREDVLAGLLEAIDMARGQSDPAAMIAGLKQIILMMGYGAPKHVKVDVAASSQTENRLSRMTDTELLGLVEAGAAA